MSLIDIFIIIVFSRKIYKKWKNYQSKIILSVQSDSEKKNFFTFFKCFIIIFLTNVFYQKCNPSNISSYTYLNWFKRECFKFIENKHHFFIFYNKILFWNKAKMKNIFTKTKKLKIKFIFCKRNIFLLLQIFFTKLYFYWINKEVLQNKKSLFLP